MRTQATIKAFTLISLFFLLFSLTSIAKTFHIVSSGGNKFDCELIEVLEGGDYIKVKVTNGVSAGNEIRLKTSILSPKDQAEVKTIFEKNKELNRARQEAEAVRQAELKRAEEQRQAELKKEKERLLEQKDEQAKTDFLNRFEKKKDEFQNTEFWKHKIKVTREESGDKRCYISTYLSVSKNGSVMRLVINYFADKWIFAENIIFLIDGKRFPIGFKRFDWDRSVEDGYISESIDSYIEYDYAFRAMKNAKIIKYRINGKNGVFDAVLSEENRQRIVETLLARDLLNGKDVDLSGIADIPEDKPATNTKTSSVQEIEDLW